MKRQLVHGSPWILASACGLLALIIGSFAISNYHREKRLMELSLLQKGESVLRVIDSGLKVSFRGHMMGLSEGRYSWIAHVQEVISQVMDDEQIHFIELVDGHGVVRAGSREERIGRKVDSELHAFLQHDGRDTGPALLHRMTPAGEGLEAGFQVAKGFGPVLRGEQIFFGMRGRMMERTFRGKNGDNLKQELEQMREERFYLVTELDTADYNDAVRRQLLQIFILSLVLLLVGVGGWLSLLTLQGLKGTQRRLSRISTFNDILIESLPVGLVATDGGHRIQTMNEVAGELLEMRALESVGRYANEVMPEEVGSCFGPERAVTLPYTAEQVIHSRGGTSRTLQLSVFGIAGPDAEQPLGEVLLLQDVSAVRGLEEQLRRTERMAALGKMAAGVAHELRNPLSSIKGLAVVLKGRLGQDGEGRKTADVLVNEVERLNRSIGELLDFARPEKLSTSVVRLGDIVEKTIVLVQVDAEQQGINLITSFNAQPDKIVADPDKLNQVFLNIMLNAVQAVGRDGTIAVRTGFDGDRIFCAVEDSGVGIAEEDLARIFDPYFTTKSSGTGLGLALSAKIVEEHGGTITVRSRKGEGAVVTVNLPRMQS